MKRSTSAKTYGEALLEHVPLCYGVALALTKDAKRARELTLETVAGVWQDRADNGAENIKTTLLTALRNRYIRDNSAAHAATSKYTATPRCLRSGSRFPVPFV